MEVSSQGADVVFEAVGGNVWKECLRRLFAEHILFL